MKISREMHQHYMKLALEEAKQALRRNEFPVGCVIADSRGVICTGSRKGSAENLEIDHAEIVAVRRLFRDHPNRAEGDIAVYSTMEPCLMCYSTLILNNIRIIVYGYEDVMGGGTLLDLKMLPPLYRDMEIMVVPHILREECLGPFQAFFQNRENTYLQGTLLAEHTLSQSVDSTNKSDSS